MSNKVIMPDAKSLQILIELSKVSTAAALDFLTFMQSELIYELTKETDGAE